jgi:small subunit ribosomal protein S6
MRKYDLMFILDVNLPEDGRREIVTKVEHEVIDVGGEIISSEQYGVRDMKFPINDVTRGDYRLIVCELDPKENKELQQRLNFRDDFLRYLLIRLDEEEAAEEEEVEEEEAEEVEESLEATT